MLTGLIVAVVLNLALALTLFVLAPPVARMCFSGVPGLSAGEVRPVLNEVLIFCSGFLVAACSFVRLTDFFSELILAFLGPPSESDERKVPDDSTLLTSFLGLIPLSVGLLLMFRCHRILGWIVKRGGKQPGVDVTATRDELPGL